MTQIHELLARIRHDPDFSHGVFELGYLDRFDTHIQRFALGQVEFPESRVGVCVRGSRRIPFHRIRDVYPDGA